MRRRIRKRHSLEVLLRRRNRQHTLLDRTYENIRHRHAHVMHKQYQATMQRRCVSMIKTFGNRLIQRRFKSDSWVCTQGAFDTFCIEGNHETVFRLFSLHFKLLDGSILFIDGEVRPMKDATPPYIHSDMRLTLFANRKDLSLNTSFLDFVEEMYEKDRMGYEKQFVFHDEKDLMLESVDFGYLRHTLYCQFAHFIFAFSNQMNAHLFANEKWFRGDLIYQLILLAFLEQINEE